MIEQRPTTGVPGMLIAVACIIIILAGLKVAAPVLLLFAVALFLVIVTRPTVSALQSRGTPTAIAIAVVILLTFAVLALFISVATQSAVEIRDAFPRYVDRYQAMQAALIAWLEVRSIDVPPAFHLDLVSASRMLDFATGTLRGLAGLMSATLLVLVVAIFGMIEADGLPAKVRAAFGVGAVDMGRFHKIAHEVQHYLAIKTAISLITGILIGLWVWVLGLDFAVLWGVAAFLLNFVPTIGSILAAIPAVMLALVQLGTNGALLVAVGYFGVNTLLGNFVEPVMMGRRLGLSPLVIVMSVLFWGWLWGPIGFLLSVPLTMTLRIMLENTEEYRWVAVMLAPSPARVPSRGGGTTPEGDGAQVEAPADERRSWRPGWLQNR